MNKIAFPTNEESLEAKISDHFGRAANFLIYDLDKDNFTIRPNPEVTGKIVSPPDFLAGQGVTKIVCFGVGKKAIDKFLDYKITIYRAQGNSIKNNLELFKKDKLVENEKSC